MSDEPKTSLDRKLERAKRQAELDRQAASPKQTVEEFEKGNHLVNGAVLPVEADDEGAACCAKPPLGLRPRLFAVADRMREINDAVSRYDRAGKAVPKDWLLELHRLFVDLRHLQMRQPNGQEG